MSMQQAIAIEHCLDVLAGVLRALSSLMAATPYERLNGVVLVRAIQVIPTKQLYNLIQAPFPGHLAPLKHLGPN